MADKTLGDLLNESQKEEMDKFDSLPKPIKYVSQQCDKCERVRVEVYDNGHLICEKCNWNHTTNEYSFRKFI